MKNTILVFAISLLFASSFCNKTFAQIKFEHGNWAEIKAKAKAEKKLIFMDAYTVWCGPCKWMEKNVFPNKKVAEYYNSRFVNAKIDMESTEGKKIAKEYSVTAFPSFLFIDGDGKIVHRTVGSRQVDDFIQLAKNAQIPEKQFSTLENKFKSGDNNEVFLKTYLKTLQSLNLDTDEALRRYFSTQKEEDLINRDNWKFIYNFVSDYKSKEFNYLLKNSDVYSKRYTADSVNDKIYSVFLRVCYNYIYSDKEDSIKYLPLKEEIKNSGFVRTEELLLNTDIEYYHKKGDFDNYARVASELIEKYHSEKVLKNAGVLNNISYNFYKSVKDKAMLAKALQWSKTAYELEPDPITTMDTYACVLSVNNNKEEAIKLENNAIKLIKASPKKYDQSSVKDMEKKIKDWSNTEN